MKVLLTNDDGIQAAGLEHLRASLIGEGLEVVVVAPVEGVVPGAPEEPVVAGAARELVVAAARLMLDHPPSGRAVINVNVPGRIREPRIELTRPGRRYPSGGEAVLVEHDGTGSSYCLYGLVDDPDPAHEEADETDFGALGAGRISAWSLSLSWDDPSHATALRVWLQGIAEAASGSASP
jgi:broad specificity polyphosphatase/5'/3'-nucleotidase SurE